MASEAPNIASCPRCGYDLRGVIDSWTDSCPLQGTCSECGLHISWHEVIGPQRLGPRWCIEYEPSASRVPLAAIKTWLHALWPWHFWTQLRMEHALRWRRIATLAALMILPFILLYCLLQGALAIYVRYQVEQEAKTYQGQLPRLIQTYQAQLNAGPAGMGLGPMTAQEWQAHSAWVRQQIAQWQVALGQPPQISISYPGAIAEAIFLPLARSSGGMITASGSSYPYPAPMDLHDWLRTRGWVAMGGAAPSASIALIPLGAMALAIPGYLLFPATLVLLPASRKRAKVRWRHIGRIAAYSVLMPLTCVVAVVAVLMTGIFWRALDPYVESVLPYAALAMPWALLMVWWAAAIGRYLRMPHGWAVAILHTVLIVLALLLLAAMPYVLNF